MRGEKFLALLAFLIRRLAWRLHALVTGGLSARALKRASELAGGTLIRLRPRRFRVGEQGIVEASAPRQAPFSADEVLRMTALSSSPADFPGEAAVPRGRWAIDTRKPIAKGLDQGCNSLDAQLDVCRGGVPGEKNSGFHTLCA